MFWNFFPIDKKEVDIYPKKTHLESQTLNHSIEIDLKSIDLNAIWIVRRLRINGFEAYLTGGCVRDLLLQKKPKDFDIATNAKPEEIKFLFANSRLIGRRFLLTHIFFADGKLIETATFRANPLNSKSNLSKDLLLKCDNVFGKLEDDAKRRDFTINALFYDPIKEKVYDFVGAKEDLKNKVIRTIGDPDIRLREDPVRILRGIKFAARLNFTIEKETLAGMKSHVADLTRCAPLRLQEELSCFLTSGNSFTAIKLCYEIGVLDVLMPELIEGLGIVFDTTNNELKKTEVEHLTNKFKNLDQILNVLDKICIRECYISPSVAFAAILFPVYKAFKTLFKNEKDWIDKICTNWAGRIKLTKKDQNKIKLLLSSSLIMSNEQKNTKIVEHLIEKKWFREALLMHIINLFSQNKTLESVEKWKLSANNAGKLYIQKKNDIKSIFFK